LLFERFFFKQMGNSAAISSQATGTSPIDPTRNSQTSQNKSAKNVLPEAQIQPPPQPKEVPSSGTHTGGNTNLETLNEDEEQDLGFEISKKINVNDFTFLKVVGKGSFGKVMQVKKNDDGRIFAMKVLKKKHWSKESKCNILKQNEKYYVKLTTHLLFL